MRKYVLLGIVAALGLIAMFDEFTGFAPRSLPSWTGPVTVKGGISDIHGRPLFSRSGYYWNFPTEKIRVIPDYFSDIVAVNKDGYVYGSSKHEELRYSIVLNDDWYLQDVIDLKVGYYNPVRPSQSKLYYCDSIYTDFMIDNSAVMRSRVYSNSLTCNFTVSK